MSLNVKHLLILNMGLVRGLTMKNDGFKNIIDREAGRRRQPCEQIKLIHMDTHRGRMPIEQGWRYVGQILSGDIQEKNVGD